MNCVWRDVRTGRRVCLMNHRHPVVRQARRRRPRIAVPWRRVARIAVRGALYVWIGGWTWALLTVWLASGPA